MKCVQLILFTIINMYYCFLCFRLLSEFMLPPSNVLRRTYQVLHAIMKDIGIEYQVIHAFPNDDILYYK